MTSYSMWDVTEQPQFLQCLKILVKQKSIKKRKMNSWNIFEW